MGKLIKREHDRLRRHYRLRKKISGTSQRPRLCVHRSHKNLTVQIIDDSKSITLLSVSTSDSNFKELKIKGSNLDGAKQLGKLMADLAIKTGIKEIVFDRGGYIYHGRIKALADSAREAGLKF